MSAQCADPWEQRKLGDLIEINSGRDYKHLENGGIPVYGTGGLLAYVNEALSYKKDAVGIGRKGTIDHPYKLKAPFWTVDTLFYAVPSSQADLDFVLGLFHRINWKSKDESTGLPSLSKKIINSVPIMAPLFQEQQKIGKALSYCDSLITLHRRKLEHLREMKRGLLQKMFPKDGESVPELRFPGFTDPWEQRKLGEVTRRVTRKNKNNISKLPLTISAQYGLVDQESFFKKRVASRDMSGYYLMKKGEFAYNKSTSSDSPWGAIKRLERYEKGCVSTLYIVFSATSVDPQFLATYYDSDHWFKGVRAIAAEGARNHGLLNIAPSDFFNTTIRIACSEMEQQAIGAFFKSVDSLITLHQRKELASMVNCLQIGGGPINPNRTAP